MSIQTRITYQHLLTGLTVALAAACSPSSEEDGAQTSASIDVEDGHRAASGSTSFAVAESSVRVELNNLDRTYRIQSEDGTWSRWLTQKSQIRTRWGSFDPVARGPETLVSTALGNRLGTEDMTGRQLYLVQFVVQPLEAMQKRLRGIGADLLLPFPDDAYLVHMDERMAKEAQALKFVRWVGLYHPALKLDEAIASPTALSASKARRYSVLLVGDPATAQAVVGRAALSMGGQVAPRTTSRRMVVTLDGAGLLQLAKMKDVLFIDEDGDPETDANIARQIGGADFLETVQGYTGQGVRGEVMDDGLLVTHNDVSGNPPLIHTANNNDDNHGTPVYGIVFGDGTSNAQARGFLPDAEQPIFSSYYSLNDRDAHTAELVDPSGPYRAVFQTNSWGNPRTFNYTTISAEMDDILFRHDILISQSQSNAGNQDSRPQAWAKNILSVGGVRHFNTLDRSDDAWSFGASIGPAADGRIKPDLWHFYDQTIAPSHVSNTAYTQFGGTSGATPITAGHMGLVFQMWADGVFNGLGPGLGRDVFDARPHMTTAKALLINSAFQYDFSGTGDDKARNHQGWGMADVENLYRTAEDNFFIIPILIDETVVIRPLEVQSFPVAVDGSSPLKATMVYADPMGSPAAAQHRINDLTLRVVSPTGQVYWGNNGLLQGRWSTPGGSANVVDTVENVFIENPAAGTWLIEVHADEVVQDSHTETAALDADYALVVTTTYNN